MMNKAFIFDLDGVLIDNEKIWENQKQILYRELFGDEITEKLGPTMGINIDGIYARAQRAGAKESKEEFTNAFFSLAGDIYQNAPISEGLDELAKNLKELGYSVGIVSASPLPWITTVTKRLSFEKDIELIISIHERPDLAHKPAPDGYNEAISVLGATPETTIILEDSNSGIKSAKASGALTIGLRQNLIDNYMQQGADQYADTISDIIRIVEEHSARVD